MGANYVYTLEKILDDYETLTIYDLIQTISAKDLPSALQAEFEQIVFINVTMGDSSEILKMDKEQVENFILNVRSYLEG